jgi:uncharacterized protein (DUF486 family)
LPDPPLPTDHRALPSTDSTPTPIQRETRGNRAMPVAAVTVGLLVLSNVFMTFAWYAHLKNLNDRPWWIAALLSWGIALFEYLLQVPANRIGYTQFSLPQLKILQEVITLSVFVPFAVFYMREPLKLDYLWAALCMLAAVWFIFRTPASA